MSTVLVTGSSSGFGRLTARTLAERGHTVFATMRNSNKQNADRARELRAFGQGVSGRLEVLDLDVSDDASVEAAVAAATAGDGLDAVVNNAGYGVGGYAEGFTPEQFRNLLEVNLIGAHRVNRAVLPSMRARGAGLLVHISSGIGRFVVPFCAPYIASKFALEGYAEGLRYELAPTGVDVVIVEPGAYGTKFGTGMVAPADAERVESYGELAEAPKQMWAGVLASLEADDAPDPQDVADAIVELVETPAGERPLRTVVDDRTGDGPRAINAAAAEVQRQAFAAMGIEHLLGVGEQG